MGVRVREKVTEGTYYKSKIAVPSTAFKNPETGVYLKQGEIVKVTDVKGVEHLVCVQKGKGQKLLTLYMTKSNMDKYFTFITAYKCNRSLYCTLGRVFTYGRLYEKVEGDITTEGFYLRDDLSILTSLTPEQLEIYFQKM